MTCPPGCTCDKHTRVSDKYNRLSVEGTVRGKKKVISGGMADPQAGWSKEQRAEWEYKRFNRNQRRATDSLLRKGFPRLEAILRGKKNV